MTTQVADLPGPTLHALGGDAARRVQRAFERLRRAQQAHPVPTLEERRDALDRLARALKANRDALVEAVNADFGGRAEVETLGADVLLTLEAVRDARAHVAEWMKPRAVRPSFLSFPSRAEVQHVPKGVVAVLAPWNYPVNLALGPLAGALAAGNRVLIKPSEHTPATSAVIARLVASVFTPDEVEVLEGGAEVARAITALPLDHILFTGSTQVGRMVARAAAENLVPVTLELGGKSPVVVHPSYDLEKAATRIAMGKVFNAGQTCIAPDYVLLASGSESAFERHFCAAVARAVPSFNDNPDATAVHSDAAMRRVEQLLEDAREKGARLVFTGPVPAAGAARRMPPVLAFNVNDSMRIMQEEIFGPILPVVVVPSAEDAVAFVRARPHPLAFYVFDDDTARVDALLARVQFGGACVNDVLMHFAQENLPFGGVGPSGMGAYHGPTGFETFSHARGVLRPGPQPLKAIQDPPYTAVLRRALDLLIRR